MSICAHSLDLPSIFLSNPMFWFTRNLERHAYANVCFMDEKCLFYGCFVLLKTLNKRDENWVISNVCQRFSSPNTAESAPDCSYFIIEIMITLKWSEVKWKSLSHVRLFATHRLYNLWNYPGQNTGVGSCSLLQGIFPNITTPRIWECMIEGDSQVFSYLLCINGHKGSVTAGNAFHPDIFSLQLLLTPSFQIILNYTQMPCFSIQFNPSPIMYITHSKQWDKHLLILQEL